MITRVMGSGAAGEAGVPSPCRQQSPFLTQAKFLGSYQVPKVDVTTDVNQKI